MDEVDDMFTKIQEESRKVKEKGSKEGKKDVTETKQCVPSQTVEEAVNDAVTQLASTL